jgi:hypothetical protein
MENAHYEVKVGAVLHGLHQQVCQAIPMIANLYEAVTLRRMVITSGREGSHSSKSLHYYGRAIDIRTRDLSTEQIVELQSELKSMLGRNWDVIIEPSHMHIELDWRFDREN